MDSWTVRAVEVIKYPADSTDQYSPGQRVLALWRMENGDWSSMFYEAVVTAASSKEVIFIFPNACIFLFLTLNSSKLMWI